MLFKFRSYLKFLLHSTNQHGIHSPFIFKYLTECLYAKPEFSKKKTHNVLLKSIPYFKAKHISIQGNPYLKKQLLEKNPDFVANGTPVDILYFESSLDQNPNEVFNKFQLHNDSLILFNNIYESQSSLNHWTSFIKSDLVTASIDSFHCGLLFIRKEQVKQHFIIRI